MIDGHKDILSIKSSRISLIWLLYLKQAIDKTDCNYILIKSRACIT